MTNDVAFVVVHERVVEPPYGRFDGFATSVHVGAFGVGVTTTIVVLQFTLWPFVPYAVSV
jgi:hypothetical protein